jgi:hypothetical protein
MAVDLPENVAVQIQIHSVNGAQINADGNGRLAEMIRIKGMQDLDNVSLTEAQGTRYIQGPHPYYGSPDGQKVPPS